MLGVKRAEKARNEQVLKTTKEMRCLWKLISKRRDRSMWHSVEKPGIVDLANAG